MKISQYIKESGLTWQQLADKCAVSRQTIYFILIKSHTPSLRTIDKIVKATAGAVTLDDLRVK